MVDLSVPVVPETVGPDEILLATVPVFGGRVPAVAPERLSALKGSGQPAVAVAVGRPDAHDLEIAGNFGSGVMQKLTDENPVSIQVPGDPADREKGGGNSPHPAAGDALKPPRTWLPGVNTNC